MSDDDLCIRFKGARYPVLCGMCRKKITFIGEPNFECGQAVCIPCGNVDDAQEAMRIAAEYAKDEAQLMVNRLARDTASKSKIVSFEGQTTHDKAHRFIVADFEI